MAKKTGIETDICWIKGELKEFRTDFKDYINKADKKYASKWTEYLAKVGILGLLTYFANQLLSLLPKAYALCAELLTSIT